MAFVNDISTEEDIEKYHLHEVKQKYSIHKYNDYGICIDRDREIVLLKADAGSPRTDDVGRILFAFVVGDKDYGFGMQFKDGGKKNGKEIYQWQLKHIHNAPESQQEVERIKVLFKEALSIYGYQGPSFWGEDIPEFIAEFDF